MALVICSAQDARPTAEDVCLLADMIVIHLQTLPAVSGSLACALECLLGAGPSTGFPLGPRIWAEAARTAGRELRIPDTLFEVVFPD